MTRMLLPLMALSLALACFPTGTDDPGDAVNAADTLANDDAAAPDTPAAGACTSHRDCFTSAVLGDRDACDPATGQCVKPWVLYLPCDTDDDCKTHYNTSMKKCTPQKVCALPCLDAGEAVSGFCPDQMRQCGFQGHCECTTDAKCNDGSVCSTVTRVCAFKCRQDADCLALTGSTCDPATGQCVL